MSALVHVRHARFPAYYAFLKSAMAFIEGAFVQSHTQELETK